MKKLFLVLPLFLSSVAFAQFSVLDSSGTSRFHLLGKSWTPSFYSLASTETDKMNDSGGRISTYNYFTFRTYLRGDYKLNIRVPFQYNTAGTDRFDGSKVNNSEIFLSDIIVELQNSDLFLLPLDLGMYWAGRVYMPTSKYSQQAGMIARLRNDMILNKVFDRHFEAEYRNTYNWYVQSRTVYHNSFEDEDGTLVQADSLTKQQELVQYATIWGKFNADTGLGWEVGTDDTWWNRSKTLNKSKPGLHKLEMGPNFRFALNENMNFILQYHDVVDQESNLNQFGKFLATNTEFVLHSFIRF